MKINYSLAQLAAIYCVYKDLSSFHTVHCCTCGKSIQVENVEDCYSLYGHFIARSLEPKLKYHPLNTHAQCPQCNMQVSSSIDAIYLKYMKYRYGENIVEKLKADDTFVDLEYAKNWYIDKLVELSFTFPELQDIFVDLDTGEIVKDIDKIENPIQEQWLTFSKTYKQDLDYLTKILNTEPIEYERL